VQYVCTSALLQSRADLATDPALLRVRVSKLNWMEMCCKYRVSIKFFPDYKHLLQDHFDTSRLCNCNVTINTWHKILETNLSNGKKKYVCIPRSFLVINACNQGKTLCSPCIIRNNWSLLTMFNNYNIINAVFSCDFLLSVFSFRLLLLHLGHAVAQLVEALRYKPEGREFDSRWCHWNFSLP